jgi:hypothetical protein
MTEDSKKLAIGVFEGMGAFIADPTFQHTN